jgi:hypothetical protein
MRSCRASEVFPNLHTISWVLGFLLFDNVDDAAVVEEINLSSRLVFLVTVCQKVVALFLGVDEKLNRVERHGIVVKPTKGFHNCNRDMNLLVFHPRIFCGMGKLRSSCLWSFQFYVISPRDFVSLKMSLYLYSEFARRCPKTTISGDKNRHNLEASGKGGFVYIQ